MMKLEMEIEGLELALKHMKDFEAIAGRRMKEAADRAISMMSGEWRAVAPYQSGQYKGSITGQVKTVQGLRVTGSIAASATNAGYPYPRLLEFSPKHHYRSSGRQTKGQAWEAIEKTQAKVLAELERTQDRIADELAFGV